jgi:hypothetical protein
MFTVNLFHAFSSSDSSSVALQSRDFFFFFFSFLLPNSPESVLIFFLFACLVLIGCYSHQFFSPPRKVTLCFENCTGLEIEVPVWVPFAFMKIWKNYLLKVIFFSVFGSFWCVDVKKEFKKKTLFWCISEWKTFRKTIDTILPNIPRKKKQTTTLLLAS